MAAHTDRLWVGDSKFGLAVYFDALQVIRGGQRYGPRVVHHHLIYLPNNFVSPASIVAKAPNAISYIKVPGARST